VVGRRWGRWRRRRRGCKGARWWVERRSCKDVLRAWRQEGARRWAVLGALGMGRSRFARELALRLEREGRPTIYWKVQPGGAPFLVAVALAEEVRRLLPSPSTRPTEGGLEASLVRTLGRLAQGSANAVVFLEGVEGADLYSLGVLRRWLELDGRTGVVITGSGGARRAGRGSLRRSRCRRCRGREILHFLRDRFGPVEVDAGLLEALQERSGGVPERLAGAVCVALGAAAAAAGSERSAVPWSCPGISAGR
jgi:hypothetical protein